MQVKLIDSEKSVELNDCVFSCTFNESLVHQVASAYMAAGRAGTKAQKTRAEVRGGGTKPWKQKGTGRARAGTIRSPLWRKGGVVFAAKPRNFKQKINKKMYKGAIRSIFSELLRQNRLHIVNEFQVETPKTKALLSHLAALNISDDVLIISHAIDHNLYLSSRNLPHVNLLDAVASAANPVALIKVQKVLITETAIKEIEGILQ